MTRARTRQAAPGEGFGPEVDFGMLFQAAPVGLAVVDADLRCLRCNDFFAKINGLPALAHLGRTMRELLPDLAAEVEPRLRAVLETGCPQEGLRVTAITPNAPGMRRTFIENVTPLPGRGGKIGGLLIGIQEITVLDEAEAALRESDRTLRASQQLSPECFVILLAVRDARGEVVDFIWEYANPAAERIVRAGPLAGRRMRDVFPESHDHAQMVPRYMRTLSSREVSETEYAYDFRGELHWYRDAAVAIDPDRVAVGFRDITQQKLLTERLELVTGEFRHRVKNSIAVIAGLVSREAKYASDVPGFAAALLSRLESLAAAQDLLTVDADAGVELADIAGAVLQAFGGRLTVRPGPAVTISSGRVTLLAMALHELATNAVKHGALSHADGAAELCWRIQGARVELAWSETGGPPTASPTREGFGSRLIADAAERLPNGALHREFRPEGLQVTIAFDREDGAAG
jgi:PAS domain S-box-containing protein